MNSPDERFFAPCSFCKETKLIVFDVEWRGQRVAKHYVPAGKVWLCSSCCKNYRLEENNHDYDIEVNKMCEVLA